jgi:uncharacterized protein YraI
VPLARGIVTTDFGGNVVIRAAPTTAAQQVGSIPSGSEVLIFGRASGEALRHGDPLWYLVQYGRVQGYVYGQLITLQR